MRLEPSDAGYVRLVDDADDDDGGASTPSWLALTMHETLGFCEDRELRALCLASGAARERALDWFVVVRLDTAGGSGRESDGLGPRSLVRIHKVAGAYVPVPSPCQFRISPTATIEALRRRAGGFGVAARSRNPGYYGEETDHDRRSLSDERYWNLRLVAADGSLPKLADVDRTLESYLASGAALPRRRPRVDVLATRKLVTEAFDFDSDEMDVDRHDPGYYGEHRDSSLCYTAPWQNH